MYKKMDEYLTMVGLTPPKEQGENSPPTFRWTKAKSLYCKVLAVGADVIFADEPTFWMYQ